MKRQIVHPFIAYWFILTAIACGGDRDFEYPDMRTELAEMRTDKEGNAQTLITDRGQEWTIRNEKKIGGLVPDSLYRVLARYAQAGEGTSTATVYSVARTVSAIPIPRAHFKAVPTDPVKFRSMWMSDRYLNVSVVVQVKDLPHVYSFVQDSITMQVGGCRSLYLTLLHDRNNDVEGYGRTVYLSVPLWIYKLKAGDRVIFSLNTYKEGKISRTFDFPQPTL